MSDNRYGYSNDLTAKDVLKRKLLCLVSSDCPSIICSECPFGGYTQEDYRRALMEAIIAMEKQDEQPK